jgi:hypothetical protein
MRRASVFLLEQGNEHIEKQHIGNGNKNNGQNKGHMRIWIGTSYTQKIRDPKEWSKSRFHTAERQFLFLFLFSQSVRASIVVNKTALLLQKSKMANSSPVQLSFPNECNFNQKNIFHLYRSVAENAKNRILQKNF